MIARRDRICEGEKIERKETYEWQNRGTNDGTSARFVVNGSGDRKHTDKKRSGKVGLLLPASDEARRGDFTAARPRAVVKSILGARRAKGEKRRGNKSVVLPPTDPHGDVGEE